MRVSLFIPCFVDSLYPQVGMAMVKVIERLGHTVDYPEGQTCCGQPPFNSGYWPEARQVAERQLALFNDAEVVVSASGSCGAMFKVFYPQLFKDTPQESAARELAAKSYEFSEFLTKKLGVRDVGAKFRGRVTFHDGCHGLRELGVKESPRELLRAGRRARAGRDGRGGDVLRLWRHVCSEIPPDFLRDGRGEVQLDPRYIG
jgi:L-lactate dehydrogenase complex protein LldE